jgi:hypothetical protein
LKFLALDEEQRQEISVFTPKFKRSRGEKLRVLDSLCY